MKIYPSSHNVVTSEEVTVNHIPLGYFTEAVKNINPLIKILQTTSKVVVIDTSNVVTDRKNIEYYNAHFDDIILKLENITNTQYEIYRQNNYDLNVLENEQNITCIIIGLDRFYNRLEKENVTKFNNTLVKGAEIKKINYIFVDTADQFKEREYEQWYKDSITNNSGIWLGSGINEQMAIKLIKLVKNAPAEIPYNFGYLINHGVAREIKLLEGDEDGQ